MDFKPHILPDMRSQSVLCILSFVGETRRSSVGDRRIGTVDRSAPRQRQCPVGFLKGATDDLSTTVGQDQQAGH
jgi:hypothetical protein